MKKIHAEDVMIPLDSYPHVPHWFSLKQAISEMEKTEFEVDGRKSLPRVVLVFDEEYRLMGMVRRRDILRGLGSDPMQETRERAGEKDPGIRRATSPSDAAGQVTLDELKKRAERPVSEVMTPIRVTLDAAAPLMEVAYFMVINDVSIVPIMKNGTVVGMARSADVLRRVGEALV